MGILKRSCAKSLAHLPCYINNGPDSAGGTRGQWQEHAGACCCGSTSVAPINGSSQTSHVCVTATLFFEGLRYLTRYVSVHMCVCVILQLHVLPKLQQTCVTMKANTRRVYRPREGKRTVLFLKHVNMSRLDKCGTKMACDLLAAGHHMYRLFR